MIARPRRAKFISLIRRTMETAGNVNRDDARAGRATGFSGEFSMAEENGTAKQRRGSR